MSLRDAVTEHVQSIEPSQTFEGHTDVVGGVIHLPDRQRMVTCSNDGSLRVWNIQTRRQISKWQDGKSPILAIALSVDEKTVISGSGDSVVRLWNIETGKVTAKWTGHTWAIWSVSWNRGGERVLSGSWDGTARVWDVEKGKTVLEINTGLFDVEATIFSPDSSIIATGGFGREDEFIKIWDADTGKLISILKGHTSTVYCLAWTPDGSTLISGSSDESIRTWDTSTWQQIAVFTGHTSIVWGIAISPNGRILASASWDDTARLWNLDNGQPISLPLRHQDAVRCVSFSRDGTLLATGCDDENAYTWDVSTIVKEAGLYELLNDEKPFLHADATRRPVHQAKNPSPFPAGFFSESPASSNSTVEDPASPPSVAHISELLHHPEPAISCFTSPNSDVQQTSPESPKARFLKWLQRKTPARLTALQWARLTSSKRQQRQDGEVVELQERPPSVVDIPLVHCVNDPVSPPSVAHRSKPPPYHPDPAIASDCVLPSIQPNVQPSLPEPNRSRFLQWLRSDTPAQLPVLQRVQRLVLKRRERQDDEAMELQEGPPSVVSVPLAKGKLLYASKGDIKKKQREKERKEKERKEKERKEKERKEKERKEKEKREREKAREKAENEDENKKEQLRHAKISKIALSSAGPSQTKRSLEPEATMSTFPTTAVVTPRVATTPLTSHPGTVFIRPRRWTRFVPCGCLSQYFDGDH